MIKYTTLQLVTPTTMINYITNGHHATGNTTIIMSCNLQYHHQWSMAQTMTNYIANGHHATHLVDNSNSHVMLMKESCVILWLVVVGQSYVEWFERGMALACPPMMVAISCNSWWIQAFVSKKFRSCISIALDLVIDYWGGDASCLMAKWLWYVFNDVGHFMLLLMNSSYCQVVPLWNCLLLLPDISIRVLQYQHPLSFLYYLYYPLCHYPSR